MNNIPNNVNFGTLNAFKRSISGADLSAFVKRH